MTVTADFAAWFPWIPKWLIGLLFFAAILAIGFLLQLVLVRIISRLARRNLSLLAMFGRVRRLLRYAILLAAAAIAFPVIPMPDDTSRMLNGLLIAATVVLVGWITMVAANTMAARYLTYFRIDVADNLQARKIETQVRILTRAMDTLIIILTVAFALMTFPSVRQFGVSLFASAGAAGLVLGFAARPLLESLIAGVQIAITQPIRIDDVLVVEGEWGRVEEITATYIVVCIWDRRRLILPLSYFLQNPFQNWTHSSASIIGSVFVYLDYTAPVDAIRARAEEIVRASKLWDGGVVNLQVTDAKENTVELRVLMSARDSSLAWDLRCEVREKLLAYIQKEFPQSLPQRRATVALESHAGEGTKHGSPTPSA